jgi:hypothetical protein
MCKIDESSCSKAFSTPHSLKSHLKTHEKRDKSRARKTIPKELNFTTAANIVASQGSSGSSSSSSSSSSSEQDDIMTYNTNTSTYQVQVVDNNGNMIKFEPIYMNYSSPEDSNNMINAANTNEAMQLALANEVEMNSPWVDISELASKSSVIPSTPDTSSYVALHLSTTVPTYIDMPTYQQSNNLSQGADNIFNVVDQSMKDFNNYMSANGSDMSMGDVETIGKTLKSITADAGICQCINCKCDPMQDGGCVGSCGPNKSCSSKKDQSKELPMVVEHEQQPNQVEIDTNKLIEEIDSLNVDTSKRQPRGSCACSDPKDAVGKGCCVVICLKTLETMKAENKSISDLIDQKPICAKVEQF